MKSQCLWNFEKKRRKKKKREPHYCIVTQTNQSSEYIYEDTAGAYGVRSLMINEAVQG